MVGARGMGAFKRRMMSLVGLGSVSDYLVHHMTGCPVAIIKAQDQAHQHAATAAQGEQEPGTSAASGDAPAEKH